MISYCGRHEIEFLSTPFDELSLELLNNLGLKRFKIASGDITNLPLLRRVGSYQREVILSSGMATMDEVDGALNVLESSGTRRQQITVLHCNSAYPTPAEDVNLRAMQSIADGCRVAVGYSDHTLGIEIPIAAVALGARVIEKHLTLDRDLSGPDHSSSLEPNEFSEMVSSIRKIEVAMGSRSKGPSPSEIGNRPIVRRSLCATRRIEAGQTFTADNVGAKRPGTGLSPMHWDNVIGRIAKRNFDVDELIEL